MKEQVKKYIECNIKSLTLFAIIYFFGIIIGFFIFGFLGSQNKIQLIDYVKSTVDIANKEEFTGINIIKNGMQINSCLVAIFILSAFTVISFAVASSIILLKGISLSMYICILFNVFGVLKGIPSMLLVAVLPNIILILVYIFMSVQSLKCSDELLMKLNLNGVISTLFKMLIISVMTIPFIMLSLCIEQVFFRIMI